MKLKLLLAFLVAWCLPKEVSAAQEMTVMSFNVCLMPFPFSRLFGGVEGGAYRVERIAQVILESQADIVCLQEVFTEGETLKKLLSERYPYFYSDFGGSYCQATSGMAIASSKPIEELIFFPFNFEGMQKGTEKGFLSFIATGKEGQKARVVATHLQPFNEAKDQVIRQLQLEQVTSHIKEMRGQEEPFPTLLVGDLNIPWGTEEYWQSLLPELFYNAYTEGMSDVDFSNCTATDYYTDHYWGQVKEALLRKEKNSGFPLPRNTYMEIIDYALLYSEDREEFAITTERIETSSFSFPSKALSDHHALLLKLVRR